MSTTNPPKWYINSRIFVYENLYLRTSCIVCVRVSTALVVVLVLQVKPLVNIQSLFARLVTYLYIVPNMRKSFCIQCSSDDDEEITRNVYIRCIVLIMHVRVYSYEYIRYKFVTFNGTATQGGVNFTVLLFRTLALLNPRLS